ncbi:MAG: serine hydrolase [Saprospiraceae bacterium]|nr:serine hydrolase [Saprospiraceae bacterium]
MKTFARLLFLTIFLQFGSLSATEITLAKNIDWVAAYDLTEQEFDRKYLEHRAAGFMMTDLDVYETADGLRYSMIWKPNADDRDWLQMKVIFEHELEDLVAFLKRNNYRLTDLDTYKQNNKLVYAALFVKNTENYEWEYRLNLSKSSFQNLNRVYNFRDFATTDIEIITKNAALRFNSVWVKIPDQPGNRLMFDLSSDELEAELSNEGYSEDGYVVVNFETYIDGLDRRYVAVSGKYNGYEGVNKTGLTKSQFDYWFRFYHDLGYRLVDMESSRTLIGQRYSGVWLECDSRLHYSKKETVDSTIKKYLVDNDLPGISVAVIENGAFLYRRGFGFADVENGKQAHGETVYLAASVSKVFGGTLAVKLHDEGRLRNGQRVSFDLYQNTRSYLTNVRTTDGLTVTLPYEHTHTPALLCSHLACLRHYEGGPTPSASHYEKAIDALEKIWNPDRCFINGCIQNTAAEYSTHALTYLAAVLEEVTGKRSAELVRTEFAIPYRLKSLRAQFETNELVEDEDRARPYKRAVRTIEQSGPVGLFGPTGPFIEYYNKPVSYENNSWKVFGGGLEMSAVDLASFGWKLLDGQIVSASARDNILWQRVNSDAGCDECSYGISWAVSGGVATRKASHGGSWEGARSFIRIYKAEDLVIAIMSNRTGHEARDVSTLAEDIYNIVK